VLCPTYSSFSRFTALTSNRADLVNTIYYGHIANLSGELDDDCASIFKILLDFGCWDSLAMISSAHRERAALEIQARANPDSFATTGATRWCEHVVARAKGRFGERSRHLRTSTLRACFIAGGVGGHNRPAPPACHAGLVCGSRRGRGGVVQCLGRPLLPSLRVP
jgi:hypothetical protein